jgi:arabinose-5-phosphate isomerase
MTSSDEALLMEGRRVLDIEAAAITAVAGRLDTNFVDACRIVAHAEGRVVVCGIGKSGHVARKIAGTLTSTGTPATFLHAVEALHGDLGIVGDTDVAILVSKSGEGSELGRITEYLARIGVPIVAMTGRLDSALARDASVTLDCSVAEEACPMELAPTSSTTTTLALGDALAMVVLQLKGFDEGDFAALHPGGTLGTKLSVRVRDVMISTDYPTLNAESTLRDAIAPLAKMRGTVPVVEGSSVVGVLTAGDLTRRMEEDGDFLDVAVASVMTGNPKIAQDDELGSAAVRRMEEHGIMALPVQDAEGHLVGIVHLHDLMRSGAV